MSFASPLYLIGLALIPVALVLYVRSERRPQAFAPANLLPSVAPRRAGWRRHAAIVGYGVAVAALLVSLAKPQATIAVPTEQARVMIVTDRSGSMLAADVSPNRLAAAKKAAATFLDAIPDKVKVGAVAFNQNAEVLQSPTRDHDAVREALQSVKAAGSTATGDAITAALKSLKGKAPAAIVLLSDGKSVRGSDPLDGGTGREGTEDSDLHGRARHRQRHDRRRRPGAARPADAFADREGHRRQGLHRRRREVARPGLQAPGLPGRHREAQARGHEPLRRRRAGADGHVRPLLHPHVRTRALKGPSMTPSPRNRSRRRGAARARGVAVRVQARRRRPGRDARALLVALLAGGHVLLEGVPGLAKTLTVETLAAVARRHASAASSSPPTWCPADIVGTRIWQPARRRRSAPTSARCSPTSCSPTRSTARPPRCSRRCSRSCRSTRSRSAARRTSVPEPFLVLATQNPIESEGTYAAARGAGRSLPVQARGRLPDAVEDEIAVVDRISASEPRAHQSARHPRAAGGTQQAARGTVYGHRSTIGYAVALVDATRQPGPLRARRPRAA